MRRWLIEEQDSFRKRYSAEEKFKIVKEQVATKLQSVRFVGSPVPHPTFINGKKASSSGAWQGLKKCDPQASNKIDKRVQDLGQKNNCIKKTITEIIAENVPFKKNLDGLIGIPVVAALFHR